MMIEDDGTRIQKMGIVRDNKGRTYEIKVIDFLNDELESYLVIFKITRLQRDAEVGDAKCLIESSKVMKLGDIHIKENVEFSSGYDKWFKLTHWFEPTNYQKQGLGTLLLNCVIDYAKSRNIEIIYGDLSPDDLQNNPKLVTWYKKFGFIRKSPLSISLDLRKKND
ncbi:MAG: GNAT family N-acetyltransferase [Limnospira sp.]